MIKCIFTWILQSIKEKYVIYIASFFTCFFGLYFVWDSGCFLPKCTLSLLTPNMWFCRWRSESSRKSRREKNTKQRKPRTSNCQESAREKNDGRDIVYRTKRIKKCVEIQRPSGSRLEWFYESAIHWYGVAHLRSQKDWFLVQCIRQYDHFVL